MKLIQVLDSTDGITKKFIHETNDGYRIEGTYVNYFNKHIVCFSTQIGCAGRCIFCANGYNYHRNLTALEMFEQCQGILHEVTNGNAFADGKPILFSAMGCGDPLLNDIELCKAFKALSALYPYSKFSLATTGSIPRELTALLSDIENLHISFKLMISLHSADDYKRRMLLPGAGLLEDLMPELLSVHQFGINGNHVIDYNVVLFDGINDSDGDATKIWKLFSDYGITKYANVKINKYNPISILENTLQPSKRQTAFVERLKFLGVNVETYETNGADIGAACGQLVNQ